MKKVLNHGFVRVVDKMGDDAAVVQAARVSYGAGTKAVREDRGLIRYLMRGQHTSPFEMCEIKFHIKMPIFVMRQWIRHRMANVNEYSGRYSEMKDEFYLPDLDRVCAQSEANKQGSGDRLDEGRALDFIYLSEDDAIGVFDSYNMALDMGVARELARINLPLSTYTEAYWKIDLHNLFHFLKLRTDPHAQEEIRAYAGVLEEIVKDWVPHSYEAWVDYVKEAHTFSRHEMTMVRQLAQHILNEVVWNEESVAECPLTKREAREFAEALGLKFVDVT